MKKGSSVRISLIGMSGCGKSHWSTKLAESGFRRFACDEMIAAKLSTELTRADGTVMGLGEWMGFPYERGYREKEAAYLETEILVLEETLRELADTPTAEDDRIVVDTTGSVIYTGENLLGALRRRTTVVHFAVPPEVHQQMLRIYLQHPRPVLWRGLFEQRPGETRDSALARCYEKLLDARETLYRKLADVTIEYHAQKDPAYRIEDLLRTIGERT